MRERVGRAAGGPPSPLSSALRRSPQRTGMLACCAVRSSSRSLQLSDVLFSNNITPQQLILITHANAWLQRRGTG